MFSCAKRTNWYQGWACSRPYRHCLINWFSRCLLLLWYLTELHGIDPYQNWNGISRSVARIQLDGRHKAQELKVLLDFCDIILAWVFESDWIGYDIFHFTTEAEANHHRLINNRVIRPLKLHSITHMHMKKFTCPWTVLKRASFNVNSSQRWQMLFRAGLCVLSPLS